MSFVAVVVGRQSRRQLITHQYWFLFLSECRRDSRSLSSSYSSSLSYLAHTADMVNPVSVIVFSTIITVMSSKRHRRPASIFFIWRVSPAQRANSFGDYRVVDTARSCHYDSHFCRTLGGGRTLCEFLSAFSFDRQPRIAKYLARHIFCDLYSATSWAVEKTPRRHSHGRANF